MAAMQYWNVSAYDVHQRPRTGTEDVPWFPMEGGAGYETPGARPDIRAFSGRNVVMVLLSDPNAPSSGKARAFDAYRSISDWTKDALSALAAVDEEPVPESGWLADALAELAEVDDEIAEEELPPVDEATKTEAERIVRALARHPLAPAVYPTQDAEIALHFKSPDRPDAVLILLNNRGRADCHAYIGGRGRRSHYDTSSDLPDAFVLDQLHRLMPDRDVTSASDAGGFPLPTTFPPTIPSLMW